MFLMNILELSKSRAKSENQSANTDRHVIDTVQRTSCSSSALALPAPSEKGSALSGGDMRGKHSGSGCGGCGRRAVYDPSLWLKITGGTGLSATVEFWVLDSQYLVKSACRPVDDTHKKSNICQGKNTNVRQMAKGKI